MLKFSHRSNIKLTKFKSAQFKRHKIKLFVMLMFGCGVELAAAAQSGCVQDWGQKFCKHQHIKTSYQQLQEKWQSTLLLSNAPSRLLNASQQGWMHFAKQCKSASCVTRQFEQRIDELTMLTNLNQSLTQHYIAIKNRKLTQPFIHLQLQQLDKNRIKIEGVRYDNPNAAPSKAIQYLRAYAPPNQLADLTDLESRCKFSLIRTSYGLKLQSASQKCQKFVANYRLYD